MEHTELIVLSYLVLIFLLILILSPSLATDSPLDLTIKSTLVTDVFNTAGVKRFDRKKESLNKIKHRMKGFY